MIEQIRALEQISCSLEPETSERMSAARAVLKAARTHVAWGQVLQARGDRDAARQHFEQAGAQFKSSGVAKELEQTKRQIDSLNA